MNKVILIGRLTRDPVLRSTPNGHPVCQFTLAVDRPAPRDGDGQRSADFIDCVAWRKTAELVATHLAKGRLVAVEGRLQIRSYTDRYGVRRRASEVVAFGVRFLGGKRDAQPADADDSDQGIPDEPLPEEQDQASETEPVLEDVPF